MCWQPFVVCVVKLLGLPSFIILYLPQARLPEMAEKLYSSMRDSDCPPTLYTMTALINAYAKEGLCEKAEEAFHNIKALGLEPDVYSYNALMGAYRSVLQSCTLHSTTPSMNHRDSMELNLYIEI